MSGNGWRLGGPSPFFTERARERAPVIVDYAAAPGAAFLVSPAGDVVLYSGSIDDAEASRIARAVRTRGDADGVRFLRVDGKWVHFASVCRGWLLCVVTATTTDSDVTLDRTRRASRVLAMALVDGGVPGNSGGAAPSGAPAEVLAEPPRRRRS